MQKIWRHNWVKSKKYQRELVRKVAMPLLAAGLVLGLMSAAWASSANGIIPDSNATNGNITGGSPAYMDGFIAPSQTETAAGQRAASHENNETVQGGSNGRISIFADSGNSPVNIKVDNVTGKTRAVSALAGANQAERIVASGYGDGTTILVRGNSKSQAGLVGYIVNSINSSSPSYSGLVTGGNNHYASVDELAGYNTIALLLFIITIVGLQVAIIAMQVAW